MSTTEGAGDEMRRELRWACMLFAAAGDRPVFEARALDAAGLPEESESTAELRRMVGITSRTQWACEVAAASYGLHEILIGELADARHDEPDPVGVNVRGQDGLARRERDGAHADF